MLHGLFPCVFPPKTHENSLGCSTLENRKNRVKKVLPQKTPFFGLFWPFLALFWTLFGPPKNPIFWPFLAFFGPFFEKPLFCDISTFAGKRTAVKRVKNDFLH